MSCQEGSAVARGHLSDDHGFEFQYSKAFFIKISFEVYTKILLWKLYILKVCVVSVATWAYFAVASKFEQRYF